MNEQSTTLPYTESKIHPGRWTAVGCLIIFYAISMVDRFILSAVAQPVTQSLELSNTQMGLLLGAGFAVLYSIAGIPVAYLIDKGNRTRVILAGVLLWSLMTAASAFTVDFTTLIVCRAGVAIGEAVLTPAAMSLIGDMFQRKERALPTSFYMATGNIMATGAFIIGGAVYQFAGGQQLIPGMEPWRFTLLAVSLPGLLMMVVFALTVREPARVETPSSTTGAGIDALLPFLVGNKAMFIPFFIATGLISSLTLGVISWAPTLLIRLHDLSAAQASFVFGSVGLPTSVLGTLCLPWLASRLQKAGRADGIALILMVAVAIPVPAIIAGLLVGDYWLLVAAFAVCMMFLPSISVMTCLGMQMISPSRLRARTVAVNLLVINLFGYTVGPFLSGVLADRVFSGPTAIASALATMAALIGPGALLGFLFARRPFGQMMSAQKD
ncbi:MULTISPECIES: MFS transporter [unclassified Pseudomonas]|uniref:MFS transporter n=1 Tax=unclassified Pseudomonas TaxID=196821 RepID=UPI0021C700B7|nr:MULTISPECIES: MFS transporter [unclassified Pseudomonas]MCU1732590.1 MFS transporter [Pseudomonas sp. 20P_3.2_Bac4]MCU1746267.1 MFS transporter [Pseudomonas sp. 20P_3.2_Bac5]